MCYNHFRTISDVRKMIYVTGDFHGKLSRFDDTKLKKLKKGDTLVICGDFGFIWDGGKKESEILAKLGAKKYNIAFIDGTHENFDLLSKFKTVRWMGAKAQHITGNIYHLLRGQIYDIDGEKVFTNAEVYVSQLEKDSDLGKGEQAAKMIEKYGDKIHTFNFGDTLPEDVKAIKAIGHTPGHTVYQKGNVLIIGDLMHAKALQLPHPEFNANFDGDKEKAVASRKRILEYAKQNHLIISGMHLPY